MGRVKQMDVDAESSNIGRRPHIQGEIKIGFPPILGTSHSFRCQAILF